MYDLRKNTVIWVIGFLGWMIISILFLSTNASAKTIKIAVLGPMKFMHGKAHWKGALLAAEEINAAGGVNINGEKYNIEVIKVDTNEFVSITDAVGAVERVITVDKADFLTGGTRSEAVLAMQEVMADNKTIWVCDTVGHPEMHMRVIKDYDRYKYWFQVTSDSRFFGKVGFYLIDVVANQVRKQLGISKPKVALLIEKTLFCDPIVEACKVVLPKMDLKIAGIWRPSALARDVTAELTAIKSSGAQIIYELFSGPVGSVVSKQWGELEIPAALVGINFEAQESKHWKTTSGKCKYELILHQMAPTKITDTTIPFWNNFLKRFGEFPAQPAATYDAVNVIKDAVERAGTLDADSVVAAMEKTDHQGITGRLVFPPRPKDPKQEWTGAHEIIWGPGYHVMVGVQWKDKKYNCVWPDGRAAMGDKTWEGVRFEGTEDYELPPWVIEYWSEKK